jgi:hypothetical protein
MPARARREWCTGRQSYCCCGVYITQRMGLESAADTSQVVRPLGLLATRSVHPLLHPASSSLHVGVRRVDIYSRQCGCVTWKSHKFSGGSAGLNLIRETLLH